MTTLQMAMVEQHRSGRLVFNVRVQTEAGKFEFPISVQDKGTQAKNENAVLRSAIELAETVAESAPHRLASCASTPATA
jgi:hypothetical protein